MASKNHDAPDPCRCGTGQFCRRHGRYGNQKSSDGGYQPEDGPPYQFQQCGGGRRILRKGVDKNLE